MHLSQKQKTFSQMFCSFLKSTLRFQHFHKKMVFIAYLFPKFRILKNIDKYLRSLVSEDPLLDRQLGKHAETLFKSQRQPLYHIY